MRGNRFYIVQPSCEGKVHQNFGGSELLCHQVNLITPNIIEPNCNEQQNEVVLGCAKHVNLEEEKHFNRVGEIISTKGKMKQFSRTKTF